MSKPVRVQINVRIEKELYDFLVAYAKENYKTVTAVIRENVAELYKKHKTALVVDPEGNVIKR